MVGKIELQGLSVLGFVRSHCEDPLASCEELMIERDSFGSTYSNNRGTFSPTIRQPKLCTLATTLSC